MRVDVLTLFPELIDSGIAGVVARARERGLFQLATFNPRDDTTDPYRRIDERPFGGGPGMVMLIDPLLRCLDRARTSHPAPTRVIYLTPQGAPLTQARVRELAALPRLTLLCGRYEGIDQRLIDRVVDEEISIGDYVLSGGELPALVLIDAIVRLLPGALHTADSSTFDSFEDGLLDCPHYTRPPEHALGAVPPVLMSGNHAAIARWRRTQQLLRTRARRPELFAALTLSKADRKLLAAADAEAASTPPVDPSDLAG